MKIILVKQPIILLVTALALEALLVAPVCAQKIQDEQVWTIYHKRPILALKPQYATYTVEYDLGGMVASVQNRPSLQGLAYQKGEADLRLLITVKNIYVTDRKLNESTSKNGVYKAYYAIRYNAEYGYELRNVKTDQVLANYHSTGGTAETRTFNSLSDLNGYMNNAFVGEKAQQILGAMTQRGDFELNPHDYSVALRLITIQGDAPAYTSINKATGNFKTLLIDKSATFERDKLAAFVTVWQQHVAKANWEEKKSEINKKVASALLENLCAASLLTEDYAKMSEYAALHEKYNAGFFGRQLSFEAEPTYGGTSVRGSTIGNVNVYYTDLVEEVAPKK